MTLSIASTLPPAAQMINEWSALALGGPGPGTLGVGRNRLGPKRVDPVVDPFPIGSRWRWRYRLMKPISVTIEIRLASRYWDGHHHRSVPVVSADPIESLV